MGSVAPEFTASSSMGSVSAPKTTVSKTPIAASTAPAPESGAFATASSPAPDSTATSSGTALASSSSGAAPNASTAAAPESGTWASLFAGSTSSAAAAATSASPALYSTATRPSPASSSFTATSSGTALASSTSGASLNAALLPFIPRGSAFGDARAPHAVEQADTAPSPEDLEYFEKNPTIAESLRRQVKISKRGGFKCGPQPGPATIPRVGINGFGRIGRLVARLILQSQNMQLVAVNDPFVSAVDMTKCLADMPPALYPIIKVFAIVEPENIPWDKVGADYVLESTGIRDIKTGTRGSNLSH